MKRAHTFTVDEANASLPLVGAILLDLSSLSRDVVDRRQRLDHLKSGGTGRPVSELYAEEMRQIEGELRKDADQLQRYVKELRELGVEPQPGPDGSIDRVDFPAQIDGHRVMLCWALGEPEVGHWHDVEAAFGERHPLATEAASASDAAPLGREGLDGGSVI